MSHHQVDGEKGWNQNKILFQALESAFCLQTHPTIECDNAVNEVIETTKLIEYRPHRGSVKVALHRRSCHSFYANAENHTGFSEGLFSNIQQMIQKNSGKYFAGIAVQRGTVVVIAH